MGIGLDIAQPIKPQIVVFKTHIENPLLRFGWIQSFFSFDQTMCLNKKKKNFFDNNVSS